MKFKTDAEYYADTSHISNSMVSAYLRSPAYFKALYVDRTIVRSPTPALEFGSAVDILLTEGPEAFASEYSVKVLKRDNPEMFEENKASGKTILSPSVWEKVQQVAEKVASTDAFKWLTDNGAQSQVTLTGELDGVKVKGKLDFLTIVNGIAFIDDLKTTKNVLPIKFHYHSLDYGYYRQACMYKQLVMQNFEVSMVYNRILAVTKEDWPEVAAFTMSEAYVDRQLSTIIDSLHGISSKDFSEKKVGWDQAVMIGVTKEEEQGWQDV
jgi:hypothetical protein